MNSRFVSWLLNAAACLLAVFLLIGLGGALGIIATKHIHELTVARVAGFVFEALLLVVLLRAALRGCGPRGHRYFVIALLAVAAFARIGLLFFVRDYPQIADRLFFQQFVENTADGSFESLQSQAGMHDYFIWAGRGWPQHVWFFRWFGAHHVLAAQIWNVLCSVALLALTTRAARLVGGRTVARLALVWTVAFPAGAWSVLDYTYQFQGSVALLAAIIVFARWLMPRARLTRRNLLSGLLVLIVSVVLLNLQRGLDMMVLMAGVIATALAFFCGRARRRWRGIAVVTLLVIVARFAVDKPLNAKINEAGKDNYYSHAIAQIGIGFNPFTRGEFHDYYVHLDRQTPRAEKNAELMRLILGQIRATPVDVFATQPLIKAVKYLQLGAASGVEQSLEAGGGMNSSEFFRGTRVTYTALLLAAALLGCWRARSLLHIRPALAFTVVLLLAICIIYTWINQISPRYSFYYAPLIAILAALPALPRRSATPKPGLIGALVPAATFAALYAAAGLALFAFAKNSGPMTAMTDARRLTTLQEIGIRPAHQTAPCAALIRTFDLLPAAAGTEFTLLTTLDVPEGATEISFLVWAGPLQHLSAAHAYVSTFPDNSSRLYVEGLDEISSGQRLRTRWSGRPKTIRIECTGILARNTPLIPEALAIGFVSFRNP